MEQLQQDIARIVLYHKPWSIYICAEFPQPLSSCPPNRLDFANILHSLPGLPIIGSSASRASDVIDHPFHSSYSSAFRPHRDHPSSRDRSTDLVIAHIPWITASFYGWMKLKHFSDSRGVDVIACSSILSRLSVGWHWSRWLEGLQSFPYVVYTKIYGRRQTFWTTACSSVWRALPQFRILVLNVGLHLNQRSPCWRFSYKHGIPSATLLRLDIQQ